MGIMKKQEVGAQRKVWEKDQEVEERHSRGRAATVCREICATPKVI